LIYIPIIQSRLIIFAITHKDARGFAFLLEEEKFDVSTEIEALRSDLG
jgi:hypothetical protein